MTAKEPEIVEILSDDDFPTESDVPSAIEGSSSLLNQYVENSPMRGIGGNLELSNNLNTSNDLSKVPYSNEESFDNMKRRKFGSSRLDSLTRSFNLPNFPNEYDANEQNGINSNSLDLNQHYGLNESVNQSLENNLHSKSDIMDSTVEIISISSDDEEISDSRNNSSNHEEVRPNNNDENTNGNLAESDDELEIIDPGEATRNRKFKQSSFERNLKRVPIAGADSINKNQENSYLDLYNKPVPVADILTPEKYANVLSSQAKARFEMYQRLRDRTEESVKSYAQSKKIYTNLINSFTSKIAELTSECESYRSKTDNILIARHEACFNVLQKKQSDLHKVKQLYEHAAKGYNSSYNQLEGLERELRNNPTSLPPLGDPEEIMKTKLALLRLANRSNDPNEQYSSNVYTQEVKREYSRNPYSSNVYTEQSEEKYLQDLLNNIRPDEEYADESDSTPSGLSIKLLKHQKMGLSWLLRMENSKSKGGILADDMGLGKTIQAIALMMANKSADPYVKTNLIIAPVSLLRQWAAEIDSKVSPSSRMNVAIFHGQEKKRLSTYMQMRKFDVVMTSYGTLSSEWKKHFKEAFEESSVKRLDNVLPDLGSGGRSYNSPFFSKDAVFYRIVLDEAQNIKNKLSIASKAVSCLKGTYRFCLSGTPMQNNIEELFPIIRFLNIKPYNNESKFRRDIALPLKSRGTGYDSSDRESSMRKLRAILKAILLRRNKNSLIDGKPILSLPLKHIIKDNVQMDKEEREYYSSLEAGIQMKAKRLFAEKSQGAASNILTLLLRLRQACCHSFLVELGQLKKQVTEKYNSYNPRDAMILYRRIKSLDDYIIRSLEDRRNQTDTVESDVFSCPLCLDVFSYDEVIVFPCGHLICKYCVDSFFSNNEIGDSSDDNRLASCFECKKSIKESDLINYEFYSKVIQEKVSEIEFSKYYDALHAPQGTTTNQKLIQDLIKLNKGFTPSAKMMKCVELLGKIFLEFPGEKVIIFSQFTSLFDLMKLVLEENKILFLRYDGSMSIENKNTTIKQFYQDNLKKVLLLSLRAGNVGLTLTCASHVIIMDPFWNPYVEEQAMDRAYRIGQQREVFVHRILIEGTVESRIMELQEMKKEMVESALDENSMKSVSKLGQRELGFLFGLNGLR